jgi:serine/threonine protein kinase
MKTITLRSSQSTGLNPLPTTPRELGVEDVALGQGGFGVVYRVIQVDGRNVQPLAVKIFLDAASEAARRGLATIEELQRRLAAEQKRCSVSGRLLLDEYPALAAVPLLSFHGSMEGRSVAGYVAIDLSSAGLEDFAVVLEEDAKIATFQALAMPIKMDLAQQLVNALDYLYSKIGFLHCDLKAEALFVGVRPPRCVLIDYDGGAIMRSPDDVPTTWGTRQDWLAPEILAQLRQSSALKDVEVSLVSELWSGAIAVHHLLFGFHPLFFLSEISERSVEAYTHRFTWPEIDARFAYFRKGMESTQSAYLRYLRSSFPAELLRHFCFTIGHGYTDPTQRTTFSQWKTALGVANRPEIIRFSADRTVVRDSKAVHLTWEVAGAKRLEIIGIGDVTGHSSIEIAVQRTRQFELVLTPQSGQPITRSLTIQVDDRPPRIHGFSADRLFVDDARPVELIWSVSGAERVFVEPSVGDVTTASYSNVFPVRDTTYALRAVSGLGKESRATLTVLVSREAPVIQHFHISPLFAREGDMVELNWKVSGAETVWLEPGIGRVPADGHCRVRLSSKTEFLLNAASRFGVKSQRSISVIGTKRTALASPGTVLLTNARLISPSMNAPQSCASRAQWRKAC